MFDSEADLLAELDRHDALVRRCVGGAISFAQFLDEYRDFHARFALDGHESDAQERLWLDRHAARIRPHELIRLDVLAHVCSDADAQRPAYVNAGRFGAAEALRRLARVEFPPPSP
jgi:hypothetical protein